MPNVAVLQGESRHESSAKQQQAAIRVRHPWENCSFTSFSAFVSTLNHQIFTYFVQRRSPLRSCYHLNLKQAFKVKNLVPMTWSTTVAVTGRVLFIKSPSRMLTQKRPLFPKLRWFFLCLLHTTQMSRNALPRQRRGRNGCEGDYRSL